MKTAVYKITNAANSKMYIGISANPTKRWWEHRHQTKKTHTKLYNAIRKYGVDAFSFEILHWCASREDARDLENFVVDTCDTISKGYNMCPGGGGGVAGPDNPLYGKPLSPEVCSKMSLAAKKRGVDPNTISKGTAALRQKEQDGEWLAQRNAKISEANKGRIMSDEQRKKLSIARRKRPPASEETRAKLSASMKAFRAKQREA